MVSSGSVLQAGNVRRLDRRELLGAAAGALVAGSALGRLADEAFAAGRDPRVAELARLVSGPVIAPGSSVYGTARLVYNERFDGVFPLAILRVGDVKDVQT